MKEKIQALIANGQTEEALNLLAQSNNEAVLLMARYNNAKKQFNMGLVEFGEWNRIQNQVNYALLDMADRIVGNSSSTATTRVASNPATEPQRVKNGQTEQSVFISYNQTDTFAMRSVKNMLEDHNIKAYVDIFEMKPGEKIQNFIEDALAKNMFVLSIISKNSLVSGWVNFEISAAILLDKFGKKWIPASIDDSWMDSDFFFATLDDFDKRLEKSGENVQKALSRKIDTRAFQDEYNRLTDLKNNFGKVIETLKSSLVVDISGKVFESGMNKIVQTIKG